MISSASNKRVTNTVGGKTARACDSCIKKRARWYCAADDAFLCQSCDSSVHSANSLAVRHERVRLQTASFKSLVTKVPSWPQRKARTRRHGKSSRDREREVPEVVSDDHANKEEEIEQKLIHRVPIYDDEKEESLRDFIASEMDMVEFAADVESLLGRGVNEELGFVTYCNKEENSNWMVKEEEMMTLELGFDFDEEELSPELCWGSGDDREVKGEIGVDKKKHKLRLDYEAVISAWGSQGGSPWTTGCRPNYLPDESWPNCLGTCEMEFQDPSGEHITGIGGGQTGFLGDGDREARVSRYREKRRTRLFSKKIRYEVRKLNAEKRPRMKGRFVKRSIFSGSAFPLLSQ